ncbi:hypothetical protein SAMN02745146_3761 [Hymenobacter daecheongensis DSM 21074]|uniref:Uncharacterized protein n=1 Tax=Hymenobacter daecheongensis DSM 21074 TaxID=1121955 RepID=A0A1M6LH98_9BACT|nr:hypothetical protein [Hymenobacter daecheongensis]SHJ70580.1 hypothetical protein SAMN02745146_3761 [Hymenobacter daecheongensis DSM 21074]
MRNKLLFVFAAFFVWAAATKAQSPAYTFNKGNISLDVTKNYLKRSAMVTGLLEMYPQRCGEAPTPASMEEKNAFHKFVKEVRPKMVMGINLWTHAQWKLTNSCNTHFASCAEAATALHKIDNDIILSASLDEIISQDIGGKWQVKVPVDLLRSYNECVAKVMVANPEYGCNPLTISPPTSFKALEIAADSAIRMETYGYEVDITKPMAQLWYFYLAKRYIDSGFEMLRLGQIKLTAKHDTGYLKSFQLTRVIREYAKQHARRGIVLFEEQSKTTYFTPQGPAAEQICIFDVCGLPTRLYSRETVLPGQNLDLNGVPNPMPEQDYDVLLSKNSNGKPEWADCGGGQTAYWGNIAQIPVYAELDNIGDEAIWATKAFGNPNAHAPQPNKDDTPGNGFPWGWDECSWFYKQSLIFEQKWLASIYAQVKYLSNEAGVFCMPVRRPFVYHDANGQPHSGMFNVYNRASANFKDVGATIKNIWDQNAPIISVKTSPRANRLPVRKHLKTRKLNPQTVKLAHVNSSSRQAIRGKGSLTVAPSTAPTKHK